MPHKPSLANSVCLGILSAILLTLPAHVPAAGTDDSAGDLASQVLGAASFQGGLIVHLGSGDGRLTAALRAADNCLVHGLDADAEKVRQARQYIQGLGIYGPVSVEQFDGKTLPYAENLVNLLVAEDLGGVATAEAMRVLAPGGTLCVKQAGRWSKTVKPRPGNVDEWTHFLHDASGNAVAHDEVVGPPRRVQWVAPPRYTRSHEHIPSIYAVVSSGGRIFYIADEAPIGSILQVPRWQLLARDAYNGTLLWKRPLKDWFPHVINWGQTPAQLERKLVAVGDRVYVALGLHEPLCAVSAATGEVLRQYADTDGTDEIICHQGILLVAVRSVGDERVAELAKWQRLIATKDLAIRERDSAAPLVDRLRKAEARGQKAVIALDADSGRALWKKQGEGVAELKTLTLSAGKDRAFYQNGKDVVCLDLGTGRQLWSVEGPPLRVVGERSVICADGKTVTALAPETGKTLWSQTPTLVEVRDVFLAHGSLWLGGFKPAPGKRAAAWGAYFAAEHDLQSGKLLSEINPENPGHHHRCYQNKATDRYILGGRRGTEFIDLATGDVGWNSFARGVCKYGVMPCNGLMYAPPHACGCYIATKLAGFYALAPASGQKTAESIEDVQLERGPAYSSSNPGSTELAEVQSLIPNPSEDWPQYRHDSQRSGRVQADLPAALHCRWQAAAGSRLSSPTIGEGKLLVASVDEHKVAAIDAASGQTLWQFTTGGRVDSPPTIYQGRAIFGCRDGFVYSLRISDGALAWRLRAAGRQPRIVADGQLESAAPISGSVLVQDGAAYCAAGRSSYLDSGINLYRVDPATGKVLAKTPIYSPDPETGKQPPQLQPYLIPGASADILSGDGGHVYLRDMVFDNRGVQQPSGNPHLFALTGFLDDSWAHRTYWILGTHCSIATGCSKRDKDLIYGRLMSFDDSLVYGYGRATVHWSNQLQDGPYRLFAAKPGAEEPQWTKSLPIHVRAMVSAKNVLLVAGPAADDSAWQSGGEASQKGLLLAISPTDGGVLAQYPLEARPVFDGMAAAAGRLYLSLENGRLVCLDAAGKE